MQNISNQSEINKMVENYRRTLTIHYYKQEMVNEKVKRPTDEETTQFYENNKQLFTLQQPIVKGAIMKVPNNVKTDKIQRKFKDLDNIAEIEKGLIDLRLEKDVAKGKEKKAIAETIKKAEESVEAMKVARKSMLKYNSSFTEGLQVQR